MIRRAEDIAPRVVKNLQGGQGEVQFTDIAAAEELFGHARLYSRVTLAPGCSIGYHTHRGEGEIYAILSGRARYNDNGTERDVGPGDVTVCGDGEGHGIENCGNEPLEFIAIIPMK